MNNMCDIKLLLFFV